MQYSCMAKNENNLVMADNRHITAFVFIDQGACVPTWPLGISTDQSLSFLASVVEVIAVASTGAAGDGGKHPYNREMPERDRL